MDRDCLHPDGRWQRSPDDPRSTPPCCCPASAAPSPPTTPATSRRSRAVVEDLTDDGYVYRFRQDADRPLHEAEGAFVLCGFHLVAGHRSTRATSRTRCAGSSATAAPWDRPGLFTEEYDVVQRQLRGNLPQAFVHALLLETAHRLGEAGVSSHGFQARAR